MSIAEESEFVGEMHHGTGWYCFPTNRFKTITLHAFWINQLSQEEAALGALLPHVMQRGTKKWPTFQIMEQTLESLYGAAFRADVGKIGDKQLLSFHLEIVSGQYLPGHPDTLALGLEFLQEVLDQPLTEGDGFRAPVVEQEKDLLRRQIQALINDKGQYALTRLVEQMADGRPFGLRKLGRAEDIERITPESLLAYYRQVRHTRPFVLFAVGNVDPEAVRKFMSGTQGETAAGIAPIVPYTQRFHNRTLIERQDVRQGKVDIGYHTGITMTDARYPALMMYAGILGGFPHSKLFLNVRERASLAYYAYARLDAAIGSMLVGAGIEFDDFDPAVRIIGEQLDAMAQGDISDQEWEFTLRAFENDILSEEDSASQMIGRQLEHTLMGGGLSGSGLIQALRAVTVDQVTAVAKMVSLDTVFFLTQSEDGDAAGKESVQ